MSMEVNNQGNGNVQNNNDASNVEKAEDLKFKKLHLGNIFNIADDGDGKVGITDIQGKKSQSVIQLLLPYIEKGAQWTQEIVDNLSSAIKQLDKKTVENEQEAERSGSWTLALQEGNKKIWVNDNGNIDTITLTKNSGGIHEYLNGEKQVYNFSERHNVTDVVYDEQNNRITEFTDENGVKTTNTYNNQGSYIQTFTKDGEPATASVKILKNQDSIDNLSSIEVNKDGYVTAYTLADGEFNGEQVTNLRYDTNGNVLGFTNKDGQNVTVKNDTREYVDGRKCQQLFVDGKMTGIIESNNGKVVAKATIDSNQSKYGMMQFADVEIDGKTTKGLVMDNVITSYGGGTPELTIRNSVTGAKIEYDDQNRAISVSEHKNGNVVDKSTIAYPDENTVVVTSTNEKGVKQTTTYNLAKQTYSQQTNGKKSPDFTDKKVSDFEFATLLYIYNLPIPKKG